MKNDLGFASPDRQAVFRPEVLLADEKQLLEMVARGDSKPEILAALCRLVESAAGDCFCSVVLADPSGKRAENGAAPSLPSSFINSIIGRPINLESGPCGMATYLNEEIISSDIASENRWPTWCPMALAHGLNACWSIPIASRQGGALGAFAIYHKDATTPTSTLGNLIERFKHIASFVIERTQIEDDRNRATALLAGEKRLLEMVAGGHSLQIILDALCRLVEETDCGCHCGILFFNPNGTAWQLGAAPTLPSGYNETMHGRPAHRSSGPCGLAASDKMPVIVSDVESDTRWDVHGWRTLALSHGLRACWSSPILSHDQKALGALAIYRTEAGSPTQFHCELIAQLSHVASIAVERTRGEAALKRSETFLTEAQRISSTGSFSWRVATNEFTWSRQAHRIFQLIDGEPVTLELIKSRIHPEDMPLVIDLLDRMRSEAGDFECEYRLLLQDSSIKYLNLVAHGARDGGGELEYIGAVQDVSERRFSEEALSKLRSELAHMSRVTTLGALTASIAHEVNQPLSGIITNASTCLRMLGADPPNVEGARETALRTIRDGNRASEVIARLRALFAKAPTRTDALDLNETAREVVALSSAELQRNHIIVRSELAPGLARIAGDRVQIQQVIINLVLNASDAMSEVHDRPRNLVIATEDKDDQVRLTVRDAGTGFDPHCAERLFDAFYTTKSNGMGIGLSVCRSIIQGHQGRLWATPNEDHGAAFSFSIPRTPRGSGKQIGRSSELVRH